MFCYRMEGCLGAHRSSASLILPEETPLHLYSLTSLNVSGHFGALPYPASKHILVSKRIRYPFGYMPYGADALGKSTEGDYSRGDCQEGPTAPCKPKGTGPWIFSISLIPT